MLLRDAGATGFRSIAAASKGPLHGSLARSAASSGLQGPLDLRGISQWQTRAFSSSSIKLIPQTHTHEHIPLSRPHKLALTLGSALASLYNPARGDMIALLSELSGEPLLSKLREDMLQSEEGRMLLFERPAINTSSVDMDYLHTLPESTFGKQYWHWLKWCNVGPDTRAKVRFIDDQEMAYVMQRYRECHDFYHLMCGMPVSHLGETVVKIFEAAHMGLPVAFLSSLAGPLRLSNEERIALFGNGESSLARWAWRMGRRSRPLIGVSWEKHWETDFAQLRASLGFDEDPPIKVGYSGRAKSATSATKTRGRWPSKVFERAGPAGL